MHFKFRHFPLYSIFLLRESHMTEYSIIYQSIQVKSITSLNTMFVFYVLDFTRKPMQNTYRLTSTNQSWKMISFHNNNVHKTYINDVYTCWGWDQSYYMRFKKIIWKNFKTCRNSCSYNITYSFWSGYYNLIFTCIRIANISITYSQWLFSIICWIYQTVLKS